jgi:hypothetical protein
VGLTHLLCFALSTAALCDELVLSPGSTFGRAASMWAAKDPHVLLKEGSRYCADDTMHAYPTSQTHTQHVRLYGSATGESA